MRKNSKAGKIAKYLTANPSASPLDVSEKFKVDRQYVYNVRNRLRKEGVAPPKIRMAAAVTSNTSIMDTPDPRMPTMQPKDDPVNHPKHYTDGGIETIDFIEAKRLGYHLGNVVKYICRAGKKGTNMGLQDLQKARWYLDRAIEKNEIDPPTR